MGCFWSNDAEADRYHYQRRAINNTCGPRLNTPLKPLYGEYRCTGCRRYWTSRLSWPHAYQVCNRCHNHVYAHVQRELRRTDMTRESKGVKEHQKDHCQMCQQLGQYCGNIRSTR